MSAASPTFDPTTSSSTIGAISLPGSDSGPMPSELLDSPPTNLFGPDHAPASPTPRRASKRVKKTPATSGLPGADSLASASLQQCLESRLRLRLEKAGSTLFNLTWSERATPSGRRYLARQVSVRRISVKDCTSWPTPNAGPQNDGDSTWEERRALLKAQHKNGNGFGMTLGQASTLASMPLASWPTPQAFDATGEGVPRPLRYKGNAPSEAGNKRDPSKMGSYRGDLKDYAGLASWPTPRDADAEKNVRSAEGAMREMERKGGPQDLNSAATLSSWPTPHRGRDHDSDSTLGTYYPSKKQKDLEYDAWLAGSGEMQVGSGAGIKSTDQLNPAHSRYLMGCPLVWGRCRSSYKDWRNWQDFLNSHSLAQNSSGSPLCKASETL